MEMRERKARLLPPPELLVQSPQGPDVLQHDVRLGAARKEGEDVFGVSGEGMPRLFGQAESEFLVRARCDACIHPGGLGITLGQSM